MIKLIATDLDGTLFYPKKRVIGIPPCNRRFLQRYLQDGGQLILISGRNPKIVPKVEAQLHHSVSLIGCNGGYYMDEKKVIHNPQPLNRDRIVELFAYTHKLFGPWIWMLFDESNELHYNTSQVPTWVDIVFRVGNRFNNFFAESLIGTDAAFVKKLSQSDNYKVMVAFGLKQDGKNKAEQAASAIRRRFGEFFEIAVSNNVIEITAKGVNKGNALTKYCKDCGFDPDEVAVCGDSGNDLYMFERFPHTFAMEHSPEHFKSQANHVIRRVADVEEYVKNPELLRKDVILDINYEKALDI
jgi:Cof subfamily protein (haloacid dehalogenase superfamily)